LCRPGRHADIALQSINQDENNDM